MIARKFELRRRLLGLIRFPPVRIILAAFWVGASIGLGSGLGALLPDAHKTLAPLFMAGGALAGYYAFVRIFERRPVVEMTGPSWAREAVLGIVIGATLFGLVIAVLFILGNYQVDGVDANSAVAATLVVAIMAGVTEEVLMRAVAFRILEEWLGSWAALVLTAVLFGALHLPNPQATWVSSAAIALEAGVMLAAAYMLTRRIWLPIGIHAAWNFTQSGIFGVATSGIEGKGYLKGSLHGSDFVSGGAFGPEASIVAVVICTLLGVLLLVAAHRKGRFVARGSSHASRRTASLQCP
ncbi:MAG TPA: CPBP family intramembrane glutamic endopeptidase [Ramlibacter sp.]|nr:CPBP family intramembrane glutamic endopeptidase [Ramlibacter sp.]